MSTLAPRGKIGILVPARNSTVEPELNDMRPPGVTNHAARMEFRHRPDDYDPATAKIGSLDLDIAGAINRIMQVAPDIILLGHSHDSFEGGVAGAERFQSDLSDQTGAPVIVPSLAYTAALAALAVANIAILTPYLSADDALVRSFFEDAGCRVHEVIALQYETAYAIAATEPAVMRGTFRKLDSDRIDAVLQVGTNLPAARIAAEAEAELGKPVLSVNTVSYWHTLRRLGVRDRLSGFGCLFADH